MRMITTLGAIAALTAAFTAHADNAERHLLLLNSGSLQTQGMALVLGNAIAERGHRVDVLLCDSAGDLALKDAAPAALEPLKASPVQLLGKLQQGGATVSVCALYLPNSPHDSNDLREGITVATPPAIAERMTAADTRVHIF
ncbi:MAG: hypothetical protein WAV92_01785 [Halopseudomonas yangmingensis]|uniref:DsrE/DsrF-like family protein n=1 Tax=Halopseudomonas yangmingensis TaxID=1720063 RepID=A0A1I4PHC8_9GAMM|nr:hypothetical protein [Halopseudomonas yangmingensis]SFM27222.1 hypothetical protein SAMN05216217_102337 [Halopseudomonas yangmingensis]